MPPEDHDDHCPVWRGHGEKENASKPRPAVREVPDDNGRDLPNLGWYPKMQPDVGEEGAADQRAGRESVQRETGDSVDERPRVYDPVEPGSAESALKRLERLVAANYHEGGDNPGDRPVVTLSVNCRHCGSKYEVPIG